MVDSREILLKLIRFAVGWETDYSLPQDVNWNEVLTIAREQGVEAIALDGYDVLMSKNPKEKPSAFLPENKRLMLEAMGRLVKQEFTHLKHVNALSVLGDTLAAKNIPFLLMKGFACGQYYPQPKHRVCGDIDIYPGEHFEESNKAFREAGIDVDLHYYRHSVSKIKGVMIENHCILCDLRGPKKQTRELEAQLEELAQESIESSQNIIIDDVVIAGGHYPLANFNALFLPWHVSAHFEFEKVTLRHLLDWALFLKHEGKDIDVGLFREAKRRYTYGFSKIADILTNLALRYFKIPADDIPVGIVQDAVNFDDGLADRVFDHMFVGQPRERDANIWKFRWNNVKRVWSERWKYKEIYGMGVGRFILHKMVGVILKVGDDE